MEINPYLSFSGNCREAFETCAGVLGGKIEALHTHGEIPMSAETPEGWRDNRVLMGADMPPDWFKKKPQGFSVSLNLGDIGPAKRIFAQLAEGGTVGRGRNHADAAWTSADFGRHAAALMASRLPTGQGARAGSS